MPMASKQLHYYPPIFKFIYTLQILILLETKHDSPKHNNRVIIYLFILNCICTILLHKQTIIDHHNVL